METCLDVDIVGDPPRLNFTVERQGGVVLGLGKPLGKGAVMGVDLLYGDMFDSLMSRNSSAKLAQGNLSTICERSTVNHIRAAAEKRRMLRQRKDLLTIGRPLPSPRPRPFPLP